MVGGDFNEVLQESDKRGGLQCDFKNISAFRDCLDHNDLRELEFVGYPFTWRNNRAEGFIEEKLDRVVANNKWHNLFPMASSENVAWDGSDHTPLLVSLIGNVAEGREDRSKATKSFRFEA